MVSRCYPVSWLIVPTSICACGSSSAVAFEPTALRTTATPKAVRRDNAGKCCYLVDFYASVPVWHPSSPRKSTVVQCPDFPAAQWMNVINPALGSPDMESMLRHSTGHKLANDEHDTRVLQHFMGQKYHAHGFAILKWRLIGSRISERTDG